MILTVTLNPALDLTYRVAALVRHTTHRVLTVTEQAGGKGLNVARVLHCLGEPVLATGLLGGAIGSRVRALAGQGQGAVAGAGALPMDFVQIGAETRRTVAVVDPGDATGFSEPGPVVSAPEWAAFREHYGRLLDSATVAVLCGTLPPGLPADAYAVLIRAARARGVGVVLDTSGEPLRHGALAGPDIVKPNEAEAAELLSGAPAGDMYAAARLMALGPRAAVVSCGRRGLFAATEAGSWRASPPEPVSGNPTGAGDACVAALARGLRDGAPWPGRLADAVALSAAAVAAPVAGAIDQPTYQRLRHRVVVAATGPTRPSDHAGSWPC